MHGLPATQVREMAVATRLSPASKWGQDKRFFCRSAINSKCCIKIPEYKLWYIAALLQKETFAKELEAPKSRTLLCARARPPKTEYPAFEPGRWLKQQDGNLSLSLSLSISLSLSLSIYIYREREIDR